MERKIDEQLEKLKTRIIKMCSLVDEQVEFAIRSLELEDEKLAQLVIEREDKVDKYDLKIEKICQKIFALNQPVAMDLRLIMSALTMNTNIERIGDIAASIAKSFLHTKHKADFLDRTKLPEMFPVAKEMLRNAIDSFIENDAKLAQKVIQTDDKLDQLNTDNHVIIIEIMKEDPKNIDTGVSCLVISRMLERLGDHATNIAEDVFFIVEAQLIKHKYEKLIDEELDREDDI